MNTYSFAAEILSKYEGFTPVATWDVNAWRLGYGSDTITTAAGTVRKVKQGDRTTKRLAALDLSRRVKQFEKKIKAKVGAKYWDRLHYKVKAALISLAYNYGSITHTAIIDAIKTGNNNRIAAAVITSTYNDNKHLSSDIRQALRNRRRKEAEIIKNAPQTANKLQLLLPLGIAAGVFLLSKINFN